MFMSSNHRIALGRYTVFKPKNSAQTKQIFVLNYTNYTSAESMPTKSGVEVCAYLIHVLLPM